METPTAFVHSIRFPVPTHRCSKFDCAIAGLPLAFLGFPTSGEVFESTAACKARCKGFRLGKRFAVVVDRLNKDTFVELLHPLQYRDPERLLA